MIDRARYEKITDKLEYVFKALFFFYTTLSINCITFRTPIVSIAMWPTYILGALLLLNRVFHLKRYKTPCMWFLVALLTAGCLSAVLNYQYDFKQNITYMICWAFYFLLLFVQPKEKKMESVHSEFRFFAAMYCTFVTICVVVSIIMLFTGFSLKQDFEDYQLLGGLVYSRLYGMFNQPNSGATMAAIAALLFCYAMGIYRRWWQRLLLAIPVALDLFYIAMSDSRSGQVVLGVVGFIYSLILLLQWLDGKKCRAVISIAAAVVIALGCFFSPKVIKDGYNKGVAIWAYNMVQEQHQQTASGSEGDLNGEDPDQAEINALIDQMTIKRDYDLSEDISNRRFAIWKSGLEIFCEKPVFGTTYCGFAPYAEANMPDTYIVKVYEMKTFDNEIVNILVSTGLVGFLPFLAFVAGVLIYILRRIGKIDLKRYSYVAVMLTALFGIAASAMFSTVMFYHISCNAATFWAFLGLVVQACWMVPMEPKEAKKK